MKFQGIWKPTTKISVRGLILSTKCSMDFIFGYWAYPSYTPLQLIIKSSPVQKAPYKEVNTVLKLCSKILITKTTYTCHKLLMKHSQYLDRNDSIFNS